MSLYTQARRWAMQHLRRKQGQISEMDITPDEAREAIQGILAEIGHKLVDLVSYDPRGDVFHLRTVDVDSKLHDTQIVGERVAQTVGWCRVLAGAGSKSLPRHFGQGQSKQDSASG